jgi:hypothetical protein
MVVIVLHALPPAHRGQNMAWARQGPPYHMLSREGDVLRPDEGLR